MSKVFGDIQKKEEPRGALQGESTREGPVFVPRCDIYEHEEGLALLADMPGVDDKNVEVELKNGVLTIVGHVGDEGYRRDHEMVYREYRTGHYRRSFTISSVVDSGKIEASMKAGVLRIFLPKSEAAKPKKIAVKCG